jgi:hypothetical protein
MSFVEAAGFLCRDTDEVKRKATRLRLNRGCVAVSVAPVCVPAVRLRIKKAQTAIQKAGIPGAIDGCLLFLDRIEAALLKAQPENFVNTATVAQGALERATLVLRKCF